MTSPRRVSGWLPWLALAALLLAIPPTLDTYKLYVVNIALVNIVLATGLNLLTGNAGQISLCNSSFMAIGAYVSTLLVSKLGVSFWLALAAGGMIATAFGCVLALPAMRLSGFYLALATLGFLEITQIMIEEFPDVTGGIRGMIASRPTLFGWRLDSDLALYYAFLPIVAVLVLVTRNVMRSPVGRSFDAVRNSVPAAQSLGISPARTKLVAFAIAALYAGLAGGLGAAVVGFIDPVEYGTGASLRHVTFIVVGGIGSISGSLVGAVVLTLLPELLRSLKEYSDFVYAALLLVFLILLPDGLVGLGPKLARLWTRKMRVLGQAVEADRGPPRACPEPGAQDRGGAAVTTFFALDGVCVAFGGLAALRDVSLVLEQGEIRGLIGPNGAGKTSLINAVTGMVPLSGGRILLDGRELGLLAPHRIAALGIGRTFQHVEILADQTVLTNVMTGLHRHLSHGLLSSALMLPMARRGEAAARHEAETLLGAFNLDTYRDVVASELPFGIQKRLDLARALAARPRLLLLDEPTSGMSETEAAQTIATARELARERGITLLVIEHNMRVIMALADRITVLDHGEKIAEGTPGQVQDDPLVIDAYLGDQADARDR